MTDPIRIPLFTDLRDCSRYAEVTPDIARQIVAMALADVSHPLNEHERRLNALERNLCQHSHNVDGDSTDGIYNLTFDPLGVGPPAFISGGIPKGQPTATVTATPPADDAARITDLVPKQTASESDLWRMNQDQVARNIVAMEQIAGMTKEIAALRAEVERLTRERDGACARYEIAAKNGQAALDMRNERDEARAEVERLKARTVNLADVSWHREDCNILWLHRGGVIKAIRAAGITIEGEQT